MIAMNASHKLNQWFSLGRRSTDDGIYTDVINNVIN